MDLAIGSVSLAIQLFNGSLQLCRIYVDSGGSGGAYVRQRILLRVQEQRYRNWGELVGLDRGKFGIPRQPTPVEVDLMVDVLAQISDILLAASQLEDKYLKSVKTTQGHVGIAEITGVELTKRQFAHRKLADQIKARVTGSIKFAAWDKDKFDGFIRDLTVLIDGLESLTGPYQKKLEAMLYSQLLHTESTDGLSVLGSAMHSTYGILSELATRKVSYLEICQRQLNSRSARRLNAGNDAFKLNESDIIVNHASEAFSRGFGVYQSTAPVMVEWKDASEQLSENEVLQRASDVASFLSTSTAAGGTHLPRCTG
jgi:hypothetical protein